MIPAISAVLEVAIAHQVAYLYQQVVCFTKIFEDIKVVDKVFKDENATSAVKKDWVQGGVFKFGSSRFSVGHLSPFIDANCSLKT